MDLIIQILSSNVLTNILLLLILIICIASNSSICSVMNNGFKNLSSLISVIPEQNATENDKKDAIFEDYVKHLEREAMVKKFYNK